MEAAARKIAQGPVVVFAVNRTGPRTLTGLAEWTQVSTAGVEERCSVELIAEQPPAQSIRVKNQNLDCQQL